MSECTYGEHEFPGSPVCTKCGLSHRLIEAEESIRKLKQRIHDRAKCPLCLETFITTPYAELVERLEDALRLLEDALYMTADDFVSGTSEKWSKEVQKLLAQPDPDIG